MSIDAWDLSPIFHYISSRKCKKVSLTIKVFVFNRNNQVDLREVNFQFIAISYTRTWMVLNVSVKNHTYFPCYVLWHFYPQHSVGFSSGEYDPVSYSFWDPNLIIYLLSVNSNFPCELSTIVMKKNQVVPWLTWLLYMCWLTDGYKGTWWGTIWVGRRCIGTGCVRRKPAPKRK